MSRLSRACLSVYPRFTGYLTSTLHTAHEQYPRRIHSSAFSLREGDYKIVPKGLPKVSKYRVDKNSPKVIKRKSKDDPDAPRLTGQERSKLDRATGGRFSQYGMDKAADPFDRLDTAAATASATMARRSLANRGANSDGYATGSSGVDIRDNRDSRDSRDNRYSRDSRDSGKFGRSSFAPRESSFVQGLGSSLASSTMDRRPASPHKDNTSFSRPTSGTRSYDDSLSGRNKSPSQNMSADHDYLFSPNVVLPALKNGFRTPYKLFYSSTIKQNRKIQKYDPVAVCIAEAEKAGVKVVKTDKHQLNEMAGQRPHQGIVLEASKLKETFVKTLGPVSVENEYVVQSNHTSHPFKGRENEPPVWIALDEVVDPQNLGAILRTSLFMGVDGVVVCHKNSAPLSAVVAKASAGALEARPTYGVSSLMRFIQDSKENGWHVVGAHVTYGSKRNKPLHKWPETGVDQPTLLIMGSEGNGLRKQIMGQCDTFIQIPPLAQFETNVDSLNVSVATGIILSKLMGGRFMKLPENTKKYPFRHQGHRAAVGNSNEGVEGDDDRYDDEDEDEEEDKDDESEDANDVKSKKSSKTSGVPW